MRKSANIEKVKEEFPIGKNIVFAGKTCVVTGWNLINTFGENCLFIVLTRRTGDFVCIDPYEWLE